MLSFSWMPTTILREFMRQNKGDLTLGFHCWHVAGCVSGTRVSSFDHSRGWPHDISWNNLSTAFPMSRWIFLTLTFFTCAWQLFWKMKFLRKIQVEKSSDMQRRCKVQLWPNVPATAQCLAEMWTLHGDQVSFLWTDQRKGLYISLHVGRVKGEESIEHFSPSNIFMCPCFKKFSLLWVQGMILLCKRMLHISFTFP